MKSSAIALSRSWWWSLKRHRNDAPPLTTSRQRLVFTLNPAIARTGRLLAGLRLAIYRHTASTTMAWLNTSQGRHRRVHSRSIFCQVDTCRTHTAKTSAPRSSHVTRRRTRPRSRDVATLRGGLPRRWPSGAPPRPGRAADQGPTPRRQARPCGACLRVFIWPGDTPKAS